MTNTFKVVGDEWYDKQIKVWVASHATDVNRRLNADLYPDVGNKPIAAIDAPMLPATLRKIEARGAFDLAHRVQDVALRYGIATGKCTRD